MVYRAQLVFLMRCLSLFLVAGLLLSGCAGLFFYPSRGPMPTPAALGLEYRDVWFESADGIRLHGWFLPAQGEAKGTILHLHGNAQNMSAHLPNVAWLPAQGFNVFTFDYRGYGRSSGTPSIDGVIRDAHAALATVVAMEETTPGTVTVFGQSLGGGIAIAVAAEDVHRDALCAVIADSAFAGYRRIFREKVSDIWLTWPLRGVLPETIETRYDPSRLIADIAPIPVVIMHGDADRLVSVDHAYVLFVAAKPPKALWIVPDTGHISALARPEIRHRFVEVAGRCTAS